MAKKAAANAEKEEKVAVVETDLEKKYGAAAFVSARDFMARKRDVIPVSPKLDLILGGGIPEGSFVILAGPPKIGKTVTSLHFSANAQKLNRNIYYLNIEGRLKSRDISGIPGLDIDKMEIIGSYKLDATEEEIEAVKKDKSKILMAHDYLSIAERKIKDDPGCIVIIDSASQLLTEDEFNSAIDQQHRTPVAMLLSRFCKRISNVLPVTKSIIIMIVHVVANTGGGHKTTSRTGGNKIQYAVDIDLECKFTEKWMVGQVKDDQNSGEQVGLKVHWTTGSTGIAKPGMKTISWIRFGAGIDEPMELFDLGKTLGLIDVSAGWFRPSFLEGTEFRDEFWNEKKKEFKAINGAENFIQLLNERADIANILRKQIKEIIG